MTLAGTINLRSQVVGARVVLASEAVELPPLSEKLVLLVHGYATNQRAAVREYRVFAHNLRVLSKNQRLPPDVSIVGVHWPGDDRNWLIGKATFNVRVGDAETAGARLRDILEDSATKDVIVVGHSLGCRLVLSYLLHCEESDDARVELALLMAAAVPEAHCEDGAVYGRDAIPHPRQAVLHSRRDLVLFGLFRPGMRMAMPGRSSAVGRHGKPNDRWDHVEDMGMGHGDYWTSPVSADRLAEMMGASDRRNIAARATPPSRRVPEYQPPRRIIAELLPA